MTTDTANPPADGGDMVRLLAALPERLAEAVRQPKLIPQEDVPAYFGISRPTLFRLLAAGKLPKPVALSAGEKKYRGPTSTNRSPA